MKSFVLLLALLLALGCTAIPLYSPELESMADRGLGAALAEVNSIFAVRHLFRVTQSSIRKVFPLGTDTTDLLMMFGVKETECAKNSPKDPQTCAFRPGFFVPSFRCSARVQVSAASTNVVSLRCGHDSSSSSESSEEVFSRRRPVLNVPLVNRVPAPTAPPVQSGRSFQSQTVEVRPRGDTFSNYLV
ncbi:secreted phosphoprotein 24 [Leuresthes tenuis]|uniref:secreted phosphoprotein 24 n=1 Tax=Leuresthes tenuis TaxID=355514 RepID=UPI003B505CDD